MRSAVLVFGVLIFLFALGLIGWAAGWSWSAIIFGGIALLFIVVLSAEKADYIELTSVVRGFFGVALAICLVITLVFIGQHQWRSRIKPWYLEKKAVAEAEKAAERDARAREKAIRRAAELPPVDPEFPRKGEEFMKKGVVVKAWLRPPEGAHTRTFPRTCVRYTLDGHPTITFVDDFSGKKDREFARLPEGRYLVTTESEQEFQFKWWHEPY